LNLKGNSRSLHPWQAFARLFRDDLKERFENVWEAYQKENPEASNSHQSRFAFYNERMKEWYEEADIEKKKEVEKYRQKYKDGLLNANDPERFQE